MATLTVTITESLPDYNGSDNDLTLTNALSISGVDDIYHRIVTVPAGGDTILANFHAAVSTSASSLDVENVKYIRVTNLDGSNPVNLSLQIDAGEDDSAADASTTLLLEAGKSFIMGSPSDGIATDDDAATIVTTLNNLESIIADSLSAAVQVEVFIASVV
tara:strand:+ start:46 stop:528 length:483 start_codon:yes stop_codon:yes gene_type:complete